MRCPTLKDLPPPPEGKTGWPWAEESRQLPDLLPDGRPWPKISIVTPSYNQGEFLEEAIRSVLLQGYPNLEYIVIDGGSTDNSARSIKKYEPWIAFWVSEKDTGQSEAINKGIKRSAGEVVGWLNSDDLLEKGALAIVGQEIDPDKGIRAIIGDCKIFGMANFTRKIERADLPHCLDWQKNWFSQQSTFFHKDILAKTGLLDERLYFMMDVDLWFRIMRVDRFKVIHSILALYRWHYNAKSLRTIGLKKKLELFKVIKRYSAVTNRWDLPRIIFKIFVTDVVINFKSIAAYLRRGK